MPKEDKAAAIEELRPEEGARGVHLGLSDAEISAAGWVVDTPRSLAVHPNPTKNRALINTSMHPGVRQCRGGSHSPHGAAIVTIRRDRCIGRDCKASVGIREAEGESEPEARQEVPRTGGASLPPHQLCSGGALAAVQERISEDASMPGG